MGFLNKKKVDAVIEINDDGFKIIHDLHGSCRVYDGHTVVDNLNVGLIDLIDRRTKRLALVVSVNDEPELLCACQLLRLKTKMGMADCKSAILRSEGDLVLALAELLELRYCVK